MSQSKENMLDPNIVITAMKNIYAALNKATLKGTFELSEAHSLGNDLNLITQIIDGVCKTQREKIAEKEKQSD
jgi:hypothetical protein